VTPTSEPLRRLLSNLAYRDAAQVYWRGIALVVMALVFMFTAWPPGAIRAAILEAEATRAAAILSAAMLVHHLASAGLVERMLASERLRWWWQMPLPRGFWRRLHWRHLIALHGGWLAATVYGLLPNAAAEPWRTGALAIAWTGVSLGAAATRVMLRDRGVLVRIAIAAASVASVLLTQLVAVELGAAIGLLALAWTHVRLDRPMPEVRPTPRLPWLGQHAVLALARLRIIMLARRDRPALVAVIAVLVVLALACGLAFDHVGDAARNFVRGSAILACSLGVALLARADRLLAGDRSLMDSWGIDPRHELAGRWTTAILGALPFFLLASLRVPPAWTLDVLLVLAWASIHALRPSGPEPALGRFAARTASAIVLVAVIDSTLPLLAWIAIDSLRLPRALTRAETLRLRVASDLQQRDDHGV
jgi:hypothetical protein